MIDPNKIDLSQLAEELGRYENQWVAISEESRIVASGPSYEDTVRQVSQKDSVILLKVPPLSYSLAPSA